MLCPSTASSPAWLLPLLLFPSAITQSFSVVLLPAVSGSRTKGGNLPHRPDGGTNPSRRAFTRRLLFRRLFYLRGFSGDAFISQCAGRRDDPRSRSSLSLFVFVRFPVRHFTPVLANLPFFPLQPDRTDPSPSVCTLLTPRIGIIGCLLGIMGNELLLVILCSFTLSREGVLRFSAKKRAHPACLLFDPLGRMFPFCLLFAFLGTGEIFSGRPEYPLCDNTYILRSFTGLRFDTSAENPPPHVFPCRQEIKLYYNEIRKKLESTKSERTEKEMSIELTKNYRLLLK